MQLTGAGHNFGLSHHEQGFRISSSYQHVCAGHLCKQVLQESHVVSNTRCPTLLVFKGNGVKARQGPQRANVLFQAPDLLSKACEG